MGALTLYRVALQLVGLDIAQAVGCVNRLFLESYDELAQTADSGTSEADLMLSGTDMKCVLAIIKLAEVLAIRLRPEEMFNPRLIIRKIARTLGKPIPEEAEED